MEFIIWVPDDIDDTGDDRDRRMLYRMPFVVLTFVNVCLLMFVVARLHLAREVYCCKDIFADREVPAEDDDLWDSDSDWEADSMLEDSVKEDSVKEDSILESVSQSVQQSV